MRYRALRSDARIKLDLGNQVSSGNKHPDALDHSAFRERIDFLFVESTVSCDTPARIQPCPVTYMMDGDSLAASLPPV